MLSSLWLKSFISNDGEFLIVLVLSIYSGESPYGTVSADATPPPPRNYFIWLSWYHSHMVLLSFPYRAIIYHGRPKTTVFSAVKETFYSK